MQLLANEALWACRQAAVRRLLKSLGRPALHAQTLGFVHPSSGERMAFDSDLPPDFASVLAELRDLHLI